MDYILEELLRQRAVLAALLLGTAGETSLPQPQEQGTQESSGTERPAQGQINENPSAWNPSRDLLTQAADAGLESAFPGTESRIRTLRQRAGGLLWADFSQSTPTEQPAQREGSYDGETMPGQAAQTSFPNRQIPVRQMTELLWPARDNHSSSAREISLALERDARRYDGGFSLY